ncbi:hypothetical protein JW707_01065 [Candidatus Woesearchaeota archaeon]|nr:hypothetical protein [Candidatus Woesearchaeota archaeon]
MAVGTLPDTALAAIDTLNISNCEALGFVPSLCGTLAEYSRRAGWSSEEEKGFLMKIFAEGEIMPRHDFVKEWNTGLEFGKEPVLGNSQSLGCPFLIDENSPQECISYAWLNTLAVMPSIIENSTYFIPPVGEAFAGYYYELRAPSNVGRSAGSCKTIKDDDDIDDYNNIYDYCRTEFWYEDESTITVKMGDTVLIEENATENGGYSLGPYTAVSQSPVFKSTLNINNRVFMKNYDWDFKYSKTKCKSNCESDCCTTYYRYCCDTELKPTSKVITLPISNTLKRTPQVYQKKEITNDIVVENLKTTPAGTITTNADEYKLFLDKAMLQKTGVKYSLTYSYPPYNILTVTKEPGDGYLVNDIHVAETRNDTVRFTTYPYNMEECKFIALWPFDYDVLECNMFQKATTELDIQIDETHYEIGEEKINVEIDFESDDGNDDAVVTLIYGSQMQGVNVNNGRATATLEPQEGYKTVYAEFKGDDERSPAESFSEGVYGSENNFSVYWRVVLLIAVSYCLVYLAKRYAH